MLGRSRQVDRMGFDPVQKFKRSRFKVRQHPARQGFGLHDQSDDYAVDLLRRSKAQRGREPVHICGYGGDGTGLGDGACADSRQRAWDSVANDPGSRRRH